MDDFCNEYKVNISDVKKIVCHDFCTYDVYTYKGKIFEGIKVDSIESDPYNHYEEEREFLWRFGIDRYHSYGRPNATTTWVALF